MNASFPGRPLPPVTSDTEQWWQATRKGRLMIQRCRTCRTPQLYPRVICTTCGSLDLELEESCGQGVVYSHTTLEKSPNSQYFIPPYIVALVRLDEGPSLLTNLVDVDPSMTLCDRRVTVVWEPLSDGRRLPLFVLIDD